jgi:hypothetical protein
VRATACGTQRLDRRGAEIFHIVPDAGVRSAPGRGTRQDAGHAAVLSPTDGVPAFRALSAVDIPASHPIRDRPLLTHAGRSPPFS